VRAAGGVSRLPGTGSYHSWGVRAQTGPLVGTDRQNTEGEQRVITGDYFGVVGIPLLAGRQFDERDDANAPDRVIISQNLAERLFPGIDPLGQRLRTGSRESEVIGVVGNTALGNEGDEAFWVYHPHRAWASDRNWSLTQVLAISGDFAQVQRAARRVIGEMDPGLVLYRPALLSDVIGRGIAPRAFTMQVLLAFAGVAVALSALGIFGVLSYGVRLRAREFGIRLALGAEPAAIRRMVLRQGLAVTLIGVVLGMLGALALARVMASMLFQISPLDPRVIAGAIFFMSLIAAFAAWLPARWATRTDPREVLQS
jgi:ABC-type antimicrobial peptide transport system permease subunit